jgi:Tol biopolymer transport system component
MAVNAQAKDVDVLLFQPEDVHRINNVGDIAISSDGEWIAYGVETTNVDKDESQIWLLNRAGGEAQRLTKMPGSISGFEWSPDSTRLVIVSYDPQEKPEKDADEDGPSHDTPKPIVVDRYHFKQDRLGYLGANLGPEARQVSTWEGPDGNPVFSPDGQ